MEQVQRMEGLAVDRVIDGATVARPTHAEAFSLGTEELRQFLALLDTLGPDDWERPTACTLWTVQDIVAHQAAHITGLTSLGAFLDQVKPSLLRPYRQQGMSVLDALNQSQVDLRRGCSGQDVIAEIRAAAGRSMRGRDRLPGLVRALKLPLPGFDRLRPLGYLFDVIYTRDMFMHRHDICSATARPMALSAGHDGRIVALVVLDLAEKVRRDFADQAALLRLTGAAGGVYKMGTSGAPAATITIDALDFCVLTSGRGTASDALERGLATLSGDRALAEALVVYFENRVLY